MVEEEKKEEVSNNTTNGNVEDVVRLFILSENNTNFLDFSEVTFGVVKISKISFRLLYNIAMSKSPMSRH